MKAPKMHPDEPSAASTLTAMGIYILLTCIIFGDPIKPIAFMTVWHYKLGIPLWRLLVVLSFVAAAIISFVRPLQGLHRFWRLPLFVVLAMALSIISVGICAEVVRSIAVKRFHPDVETRNSFYRSLGMAPAEFQFELHGSAIKDCIPYGWSYSMMSFYRIPPAAERNVMPGNGLDEC